VPQAKSQQPKAQIDARTSAATVASTSPTQGYAMSLSSASTSSTAETTVNASQPVGATAPGAPVITSSASIQPAETAEKSKTSSLYLEVAFKDEKKADGAVDKLSQLGYRTILLHKNLLWMQSYHVEIGPYPSEKDAAEVQQSLADRGFKAHPVNLPPL
jgi:cell division septation protein DedD